MTSPGQEVRITVLSPSVEEHPRSRTLRFTLKVESRAPLPRAPHGGTVRLAGLETTVTGEHPCRLLKPFTIEFESETEQGALYEATLDLSDEVRNASSRAPSDVWLAAPYTSVHDATNPTHPPPLPLGGKRPAESIDVICKRIAGVFGRYCEEFRPPSVSVRLDN